MPGIDVGLAEGVEGGGVGGPDTKIKTPQSLIDGARY